MLATCPNYSWWLAVLMYGGLGVYFAGLGVAKLLGALRLRRSTRVRHIKRGSTYKLVSNFCEVQTSRPVTEGEMLTIYRCEKTGKFWARPSMEFNDGRFEPC